MMKNKAEWIIGGIFSLIIVVCLVAFIYFHFLSPLDLFKKGPIKKVNLAGWEKLETGMTKADLIPKAN